MKLLGILELVLLPLGCACGLALAIPGEVQAPTRPAPRELPLHAPADGYLDLGVAPAIERAEAYQRPRHEWEREAGRRWRVAESLYVDVNRQRP